MSNPLAVFAVLSAVMTTGQVASSSPGAAPRQASSSAPPGVTMQGRPTTAGCKYTGSHTATIRLTVSPSGRPTGEMIDVSSGNKCLDRQALKTVAGYHFNPAIRHGQPMESHLRLQVNYKSN